MCTSKSISTYQIVVTFSEDVSLISTYQIVVTFSEDVSISEKAVTLPRLFEVGVKT